MFIDSYVFAQIMGRLPRRALDACVVRYRGEKYAKNLSCREQFLAMAFGQLSYRESLRDVVACLSAHREKRYHLGFNAPLSRSTLAEANERRDWRIWRDLALVLIEEARKLYLDEPAIADDIQGACYAIDSSSIELCLSIFHWAPYVSTKAAVKLHLGLDIRGSIPAFFDMTAGNVNDVNFLDTVVFEQGAFYIMDRGYIDFKRLHRIHEHGAFFVTRAKKNTRMERRYSNSVDRTGGVIADQIVFLTGVDTARTYPETLRRIKIAQNFLASDSASGYYGPLTRAAVITLQKSHGLEPVGHVGPKTRAILNASIASALSGASVAPPKPSSSTPKPVTPPYREGGGGGTPAPAVPPTGGGGGGGAPSPPLAEKPAQRVPSGYLDSFSTSSVAVGWAFDPDSPETPIEIRFYIDGPSYLGILAGTTSTAILRPDVNKTRDLKGKHGFSWQLLDAATLGTRQFYAYAVDTDTGLLALLKRSPIQTLCTSSGKNAYMQQSSVKGFFKEKPFDMRASGVYAGAIFSFVWDGKEFIDSYDHGRELQSAVFYDGASSTAYMPSDHGLNPTEAGSACDFVGPQTTSVLQEMTGTFDTLSTKTRMAYWWPGPGGIKLSDDVFLKKVKVGIPGMPNVIEYLSTFRIAETHRNGLFEPVTGYMPADFTTFWSYDPTVQALARLATSSNYLSMHPVILSTRDGTYAMGVYSPDVTGTDSHYLYKDFMYTANPTTKWSTFFSVPSLAAGEYSYRAYIVFGSVDDVKKGIDVMHARFNAPNNHRPFGYFDVIQTPGIANGWAYDPDASSTPFVVHIYMDGPKESGVLIGTTITNTLRSDVNKAKNISGNHGFSWSIPPEYLTKQHYFWVYAGDVSDQKLLTHLGRSRKWY